MVKNRSSIKYAFINAKVIFWDFDGVIKNSVEVKTRAFEKLFNAFGKDVVKQVTTHHKKNGGISRFEKIPLYLKAFAGLNVNNEFANEFIQKFSDLVIDQVIQSPWITGVEEIIKSKNSVQKFVLVTGTPDDEIKVILKALKIRPYFDFIFGSPNDKTDIIQKYLEFSGVRPQDCLYFGDSYTDYSAAAANDVPFVYVIDGSAVDDEIKPQYLINNFTELVNV